MANALNGCGESAAGGFRAGVAEPELDLKNERTSRLVDILSESAAHSGPPDDPRLKREVIGAILQWRAGMKMDGLRRQLEYSTIWFRRLVLGLAAVLLAQAGLFAYLISRQQ